MDENRPRWYDWLFVITFMGGMAWHTYMVLNNGEYAKAVLGPFVKRYH